MLHSNKRKGNQHLFKSCNYYLRLFLVSELTLRGSRSYKSEVGGNAAGKAGGSAGQVEASVEGLVEAQVVLS